jgi:hypothetical protein
MEPSYLPNRGEKVGKISNNTCEEVISYSSPTYIYVVCISILIPRDAESINEHAKLNLHILTMQPKGMLLFASQ